MYPFQSALHRQKAFYIQILNNLQKLPGDSIRLGQEKICTWKKSQQNQTKHILLLES